MGRAKVRLAAAHLNTLLSLPEGNRVVAAQAGMDPFGIELVVEGPDLPFVLPEAESPYAQTMVQVREGRLCIDFVWPDADPEPREPRGVSFTREQVEAWVGHGLTDDQIEALEDALPNSSLPECVDVVAHEALKFDDFRVI